MEDISSHPDSQHIEGFSEITPSPTSAGNTKIPAMAEAVIFDQEWVTQLQEAGESLTDLGDFEIAYIGFQSHPQESSTDWAISTQKAIRDVKGTMDLSKYLDVEFTTTLEKDSSDTIVNLSTEEQYIKNLMQEIDQREVDKAQRALDETVRITQPLENALNKLLEQEEPQKYLKEDPDVLPHLLSDIPQPHIQELIAEVLHKDEALPEKIQKDRGELQRRRAETHLLKGMQQTITPEAVSSLEKAKENERAALVQCINDLATNQKLIVNETSGAVEVAKSKLKRHSFSQERLGSTESKLMIQYLKNHMNVDLILALLSKAESNHWASDICKRLYSDMKNYLNDNPNEQLSKDLEKYREIQTTITPQYMVDSVALKKCEEALQPVNELNRKLQELDRLINKLPKDDKQEKVNKPFLTSEFANDEEINKILSESGSKLSDS